MALKDKAAYNRYMRKYMLRRYYRRRRAAIKKLGGKCCECGRTRRLQIDHIDRATKKYDIAKLLASGSAAKVAAELAKCQVLCRACHEIKTLRDLGQKRAKGMHGTVSSYKYCRCALCRAAKADVNRKYRAARKRKGA